MSWNCHEFHLVSIFLHLFVLFIYLRIYWTIELGAILAQALRWSEFALPPSPVCLLCSVLSTGTFAVVIACTLPSGLLGFLPLWEGRKAGRTASMYMYASEPPNPLWAFYEDLMIFYRNFNLFWQYHVYAMSWVEIDVCLCIYILNPVIWVPLHGVGVPP